MKKNVNRPSMDLSITPLRLATVIIGFVLIALDSWFGWNIPKLSFLVTTAILLSVFLTQPKRKAN